MLVFGPSALGSLLAATGGCANPQSWAPPWPGAAPGRPHARGLRQRSAPKRLVGRLGTQSPTVDSKKLEYGPGATYAGSPSSLGFGVGGKSYSNFLACIATLGVQCKQICGICSFL